MKIGLWNIHLLGLVLAVARVDVPYIPTEKRRRTSRFLLMAKVPLTIIVISVLTIAATLYRRLYWLPEAEVRITTEVTFGMIFFLLVNVVMMSGRLYAAWTDRSGRELET